MDSSRPDLRKITRRTAFGLLGAGAVSVGLAAYLGPDVAYPVRPAARTGNNPLVAENALPGEHWLREGALEVDDVKRQIQGYASATSVEAGRSVGFHVGVAEGDAFDVGVYRVGHYGGAGARLMTTSPTLKGEPRKLPVTDPVTGRIECDWPESWRLEVPADWRSGLYIAAFTTEGGHRSYTPFVVTEQVRGSDILLVVPTTTYQAYNLWPFDKVNGRNLYKGFLPGGEVGGKPERAVQVSFNRPYAEDGFPSWFWLESATAQWAEERGYDVTYADSIDLHEGRVDPEKYTAIVFSGHDEYWSKSMRDVAERAVKVGTHLAFFAANNVYWHIRVEGGNRHVTCYKDPGLDPSPDEAGQTVRWRKLDKRRRSEQKLLGIQYNGIPEKPTPLVVREPDHWFWTGTGVAAGTELAGLVGGEADGFHEKAPKPKGVQTLLSASPYTDRMGRGVLTQNTSLVEDKKKTLVFAAGTFLWAQALGEQGPTADTVRRATANLFDRMLAPRE